MKDNGISGLLGSEILRSHRFCSLITSVVDDKKQTIVKFGSWTFEGGYGFAFVVFDRETDIFDVLFGQWCLW